MKMRKWTLKMKMRKWTLKTNEEAVNAVAMYEIVNIYVKIEIFFSVRTRNKQHVRRVHQYYVSERTRVDPNSPYARRNK